jgi:hypothetical protein
VDLAFGRVIAPLEGETGGDRDQVISQPLRKPGQLRDPAVGGVGHPRPQVMAPTLPDRRQKRLGQPMRLRNAWIHLAELVQMRLGLTRPLGGRAHDGERHRTGGMGVAQALNLTPELDALCGRPPLVPAAVGAVAVSWSRPDVCSMVTLVRRRAQAGGSKAVMSVCSS